MTLHDLPLAPTSILFLSWHGLTHSILYAMTMLLFLDLAKHLLVAEPFSPSLEVIDMASSLSSADLCSALTSLVPSHALVPPPSLSKRGPQLFSVPLSWFLPLALLILIWPTTRMSAPWQFVGFFKLPCTLHLPWGRFIYIFWWDLRSAPHLPCGVITDHLLDSVTSAYDSFQLFWDDSP